MATVLFGLASFIAGIASFLIFSTAKTSIHGIGGMVLGLISAVFGVGSVLTWYLYMLPARIAGAIARVVPPLAEAAVAAQPP